MLTANCGSAQFKPKPNVETIYDYFLGHTGSKDSTLVSAHRGLVTDIIPENSIGSILAAAEAGILSVEIDIRLTADGEVVCLHDHGIGRITNIAEHRGRKDGYNKYKGSGFNPLVNTLSWTNELQYLRLKDRHDRLTDEPIMRLNELLECIRIQSLELVVLLDIKEKEVMGPTYEILRSASNARGIPALEWCIFKPDVKLCPLPSDLESLDWYKTESLRIIPVIEPSCRFEHNLLHLVKTWASFHSSLALEIGLRSPQGPLQDVLDWVAAGGTSLRLGYYAALPDPILPLDTTKEGGKRNMSFHEGEPPSCYADRLLEGESPDNKDHRGNLALYSQLGYSWVIADLTPESAVVFAGQRALGQSLMK